jgi:hypothetical protein
MSVICDRSPSLKAVSEGNDFPAVRSARREKGSASPEKTVTEIQRPRFNQAPRHKIVIGGYADDKLPEKRGVPAIASIIKMLEEAGIPCCAVNECALIYYGAKRIMVVSKPGSNLSYLFLNPKSP